jgi:hypothetical protein
MTTTQDLTELEPGHGTTCEHKTTAYSLQKRKHFKHMEAQDTGDTGMTATQILIELESGHGTTSKHKTTA